MPETRMAPPWLVRDLVALGVPESLALTYGMRQAFAVLNSMRKKSDPTGGSAVPMLDAATTNSATISECGRYRYDLRRTWDDALRPCLFVMLNPSTADATADDPTIRRCVGFAKAWGCGGIVVVNLFALRSTDPAGLKKTPDPVGPLNDQFIRKWAEQCHPLVAAWGVHGAYKARNVAVRRMFGAGQMDLSLCHLGLTKDGHPKHPLYLKADSKPAPFPEAACGRRPAQTTGPRPDCDGRGDGGEGGPAEPVGPAAGRGDGPQQPGGDPGRP